MQNRDLPTPSPPSTVIKRPNILLPSNSGSDTTSFWQKFRNEKSIKRSLIGRSPPLGAASRYILHKRIARGGMAEIFLAIQVGQDGFRRLCCVKRILPHYSEDAEFVEMFRDEAHIGKRLNHVNIVGIESFEQVEGSYGIIMEFINGSDLRSILSECERKGRRLSTAMAAYLIAEAARGLHYAHTKVDDLSGHPLGIIHRDISPQNILISYEGEAKITDFGIAAASSKLTETKPGIVKGKYSYMSPEQISARPLDARSDIFALAVVLWETLSMKRLFHGESEVATIQLVKNCTIPDSLSALNPDIDPELEMIVRKGLQQHMADRYRSASEFANTLTRYLAKHHANFTPDDLRSFLHDLMKQKIDAAKTDIRQALDPATGDPGLGSGQQDQTQRYTPTMATASQHSVQSPHAQHTPKSGQLPLQGQPVDFSLLSTPSQHQQQPHSRNTQQKSIHGHQNPRPKVVQHQKHPHYPQHRNQRQSSSLPTLLFMIAAAAAVALFLNVPAKFYNNTGSTLILRTKPSRVQVRIDGKALFGGRYLDTSDGRSIPLEGNERYNLTIRREGFLPETMTLQTPDEGTLRKNLTLTPLQTKTAPVKVIARGKANVWVELDNGMSAGVPPLAMDHVSFGQPHHLKVYSRNQKTFLFDCRFVPRATNWSNPYLVRVHTDKKACDYPPSES
ncbi:MAG: protein kinase [Oligoflexales bacterium]